MNIPDETSELIQPFLSNFNKYKSNPLNKKEEKQLTMLLSSLYNDIDNSYKKTELLDKKSFIGNTIIINSNNNKTADRLLPNSYNSSIFPRYIRNYLEKNEKQYIIYECKINERAIKLIFTLFTSDDVDKNMYDEDVKMIYRWLTMCTMYSTKTCTKSLTIYIYKTPFKKQLPNNKTTILSNEHVNTAYTSNCSPMGEIVIFRNEEWFKVLIHETFHTFGLDFSACDSTTMRNINYSIKKLFPINSEINLYEAYAESWARILNSCFYSYNSLDNKAYKKQFIINSTFCLELERMFTIYQCNKVLRFMGIQYEDICNHNEHHAVLRKNLYKENTNVFSYYIMTSIFMNDYYEFLNWCHSNNSENKDEKNRICLKFKNTPDSYKKFIEYISRHYNCNDLLEGLENMKSLHKKIIRNNINNININIVSTTRMTLFG